MDGFNADALVAWFKQNPSAIPEQFSTMPEGTTSITEPGEATTTTEVAATPGSVGKEGEDNAMDTSSGEEMFSQSASSDSVESPTEEVS